MADEFRDKMRETVFGVPTDPAKKPSQEGMVEFAEMVDELAEDATATDAALDSRLDATEAVANDANATAEAALEIAQTSAVPPLLSVNARQTTALPAFTYANGTLGVGATITANANGALSSAVIDGVTPSALLRIAIMLEGSRNGVYVLTAVGSAGAPYVFTRATDADVAAELGLCNFAVTGGTIYKGWRFQCQQKTSAITVGTTVLTFVAIAVGVELDFATDPEMVAGTLPNVLASPAGTKAAINDYVDRPVDADETKFLAAIADDDDFVGAGLRANSNWAVVGLEVGEGETPDLVVESIDEVNDYALVVADEDGRVAFAVLNDGSVVFDGVDTSGSGVAASDAIFDYDINIVVQYGQSNAMGTGGSPVLSTAQAYTTLMFGGGGVRPWIVGSDPAVIYTAFVPLVETSLETGAAGMADMIMERVIADNGLDPTLLGYQMQVSVAAQSGQSLLSLSKGGIYFTRLLQQVQYAALRSADLNKTCAVRVLPYIQGEAETSSGSPPSIATYKAGLKQLRLDYQTDIAPYIPLNPTIQMLVTQVASHRFYPAGSGVPDIARAQLEACDEDVNLHLVAPTYMLDYPVDGIHSSSASKKWIGAYMGLAYKRLIIDQEELVEFRCIKTVRQGKTVTLEFSVPEGPLILDTSWVSNPGTYGFKLFNNLGAAMTINSVDVVSPSRVRIVSSATIPVDSKVTYAYGLDITLGTFVGRTTGPRGCLRDSQGDRIVFDPNGIDRPMHNYCPIFETTLA